MSFSVLWQGHPVSITKSFRTKKCYLCMKERVHILKQMYLKKCPIINNKSKIYSSCRHNTKFHRFAKFTTGTDESEIGRKSYDSNRNNCAVSRTCHPPLNLLFYYCMFPYFKKFNFFYLDLAVIATERR